MRKTLKRLLCTAVATVAAVGALMTVNVFADTTTFPAVLDLKNEQNIDELFDPPLNNGVPNVSTTINGIFVYEKAFGFYDSYSTYGIKAKNGNLLSVTVSEAGNYTFAVTDTAGTADVSAQIVGSASGKQEGTIASKKTSSIVYRKSSSTEETLTLAIPTTSNNYLSNITITQSDYKAASKTTVKGSVSGLDSKDSSVTLTFKGNSSTTVSESDYASTGIQLEQGVAYTVTALGNGGGVYKATSTVEVGTEATQTANIKLERISFDFPLDFSTNNSDMATYISYITAYPHEDAYSGLTVYTDGVLVNSAQYGAKTNSNDIISFAAKETGTVTVKVHVTATNSDTLSLKVNNEIKATSDTIASAGDVTLTADVEKGQTVELYTNTRSNLYYSTISVNYVADSLVGKLNGTANTKAAVIGTNGNEYFAIVVVDKNSVGETTTLTVNGKNVPTVYTAVSIKGETLGADYFGGSEGDYVYGYKVTATNNSTPKSLTDIQNRITVAVSNS